MGIDRALQEATSTHRQGDALSTSGRQRLAAAVIAACVFGAVALAASLDHLARTRQDRVDAGVAAQEVALRLQGVLNNRLSLTGGLAAFARSSGHEIEQADFERFAEGLAESFEHHRGATGADDSVRSLQLAPGGVVTHVWPVEGNEAAVGHDIFADPERGPAVRRAVATRSFVLAGPFTLKQGGTGLIGRSPIFLDEEDRRVVDERADETDGTRSFWGFATVVLDFDEVLSLAEIDPGGTAAIDGFDVVLRGRDGLGHEGEAFLGDVEALAGDPVLVTINLPEGSWELAAAPEHGWAAFGERTVTRAILAAGLAVALAVGALALRWLSARSSAQRAADDLAAVLESIDGPVLAADHHLRVTYWNDRMAELTGIGASGAVGRPLGRATRAFTARNGGPRLVEVARLATSDLRSRSAGTTIVDVDGEVRDFDFGVGSRWGRGIIAVGVDATDRLSHDRIAADLDALEHAAHLKDRFVAETSHEMRTPLTSILGLAEMLADGDFGELNPPQRRAIATIDRTGSHLLAVVNQILDIAEITANGVVLERERVRLDDVVGSIVAIVEPIASAKGVELSASMAGSCDRGDGADRVLHADPTRLREVVMNLMSNAVKFTGPGGRVDVELRCGSDAVTLDVIDTGVGIPADQQHMLFKPFSRLTSSTFSTGTGLGLTITAQIVEAHGGTISVESEPGVRTVFSVTLPTVPHDAPGSGGGSGDHGAPVAGDDGAPVADRGAHDDGHATADDGDARGASPRPLAGAGARTTERGPGEPIEPSLPRLGAAQRVATTPARASAT